MMVEDGSIVGVYVAETQTDEPPQTQPLTQPFSQTANSFPSNLWAILLSTSSATSSASSSAVHDGTTDSAKENTYPPRPARFEMRWGKHECMIGRHPKADVVLEGKKISSWHAKIWIDPERLGEGIRLMDLSTNGTFVRGRKVGKNKVTLLSPGDDIIFGPATTSFDADFRYIFQCPPPAFTPSQGGGAGDGGGVGIGAPWGIAESDGGGIHELYEVREQIGKGSFASVRKAIRRSDGRMMAVKIIQKARFISNPKTMEMISREVEIMKALDHKYCVRYMDYFEDDQRMWLVMEYVDGGDLLDYVMKRQGLSESDTREIALMVCEAVAYLHSKRVTHRDIKPENLLLTRGARPLAKVTDFGLAKMVDGNTMLRTACGTPSYLAPEVILKEAQAGYGPAVDAWSIGVVLFSCLTNSTPFDESESTPLPQRMKERSVDFGGLREFGISEIAIDFLRRLLMINPAERMTVQDALSHPWLATSSTANSTRSLPLHVSSLPYNAGLQEAASSLAETRMGGPGSSLPFGIGDTTTNPSMTSAGPLEGEESFGYSQKLDQLRLGTPGRSMASASQTTPDEQDRSMEVSNGDIEDPVAAVGDEGSGTVDVTSTPVALGVGVQRDMTMKSPFSSDVERRLKRKEPASKFSSESDFGEDDVDVGRGSAMSVDVNVSANGGANKEGEGEKEEVVETPTTETGEEKTETEAEAGTEIDGAADGDGEDEDEDQQPEQNLRRSARRASSRPSSTPQSKTRSSTKRITASPVSPSFAGTGDESGSGMTTRRKAKAARLS